MCVVASAVHRPVEEGEADSAVEAGGGVIVRGAGVHPTGDAAVKIKSFDGMKNGENARVIEWEAEIKDVTV